MRITLFDVLFLIALCGGAAWGFYRGLLREAAGTIVLYLTTVIATLTYRSFSRLLGETEQSASATDVLSFIILMAVGSLLLTLIVNDLLRHVNPDRMPIWMNLAGMVFGFLNMAIWCAIILIVLRSATGGDRWPGYEGVQQFFISQTRGSWMAYLFRPFMRFLLTLIQPWLFGHTMPPLLYNAL